MVDWRSLRGHRLTRRGGELAVGVLCLAMVAAAGGVALVVRDHSHRAAPAANGVTPRLPAGGIPTLANTTQIPPLHIVRGWFTAMARFDDGALTVAPPTAGNPQHTLDDAIAAFRSSQPQEDVANVVVGVADVRFGARVAAAGVPTQLKSAWVVSYEDKSARYCPVPKRKAPPGTPPPDTVFVYADGLGISYTGSGAICDRATSPNAVVATQYVSVAWNIVSRSATGVTFRYEVPGCPTPYGANAGRQSTTSVEISVIVELPMNPHSRCASSHWSTTTFTVSASDSLLAAPLGPTQGITNLGGGFVYATSAP
jgi:hypothetical protein